MPYRRDSIHLFRRDESPEPREGPGPAYPGAHYVPQRYRRRKTSFELLRLTPEEEEARRARWRNRAYLSDSQLPPDNGPCDHCGQPIPVTSKYDLRRRFCNLRCKLAHERAAYLKSEKHLAAVARREAAPRVEWEVGS